MGSETDSSLVSLRSATTGFGSAPILVNNILNQVDSIQLRMYFEINSFSVLFKFWFKFNQDIKISRPGSVPGKAIENIPLCAGLSVNELGPGK